MRTRQRQGARWLPEPQPLSRRERRWVYSAKGPAGERQRREADRPRDTLQPSLASWRAGLTPSWQEVAALPTRTQRFESTTASADLKWRSSASPVLLRETTRTGT